MNKESHCKAVLFDANIQKITNIVESLWARASCGGEATPRNWLEVEGGGGMWNVEERGGG
jgi:hypothetical protein